LSGAILATMYQFTRYSTLAEADIFLAPIVAGVLATFAYLEIARRPAEEESTSFLGRRPWPVFAFFVLLGLTNLAKGLVFGAAMALIPIAAFVLWNIDIRGLRRYVWLWGWLTALVIALAWPIAVYQIYPDAVEVWTFDLFGRLGGHYLEEPKWYYLAQLPWVLLPWTPLAAMGFLMTRASAFRERGSPQRLLWCWALFPAAVFSFAQGKHHHYLIHSMAPWAIFAATATVRLWNTSRSWPGWLRRPIGATVILGALGNGALLLLRDRLPGPHWVLPGLLVGWPLVVLALSWAWWRPDGRSAAAAGFTLLVMLYWIGFTYKAIYLHKSHEDTVFLQEAVARTGPRTPLLVNTDGNSLEGLRILFYLKERGRALHNLSFLLDERLAGDEAYVITRHKDRDKLERFGKSEVVVQSKRSRREESHEDRWTLFHVSLDAELPRQPGNVRISPMQAMYREDGPFLE
jgi:4-amino-4-deoxy-L-arabinose transferase-like glycosyltransferase